MRRKHSNQIVIGLIFVVAGAAMTLNNIGVLHVGNLSRLWPLIVIAMGVGRLLNPLPGGHREGNGLWMVMIGTWLLLNTLHIFRWRDSWPLVIVAAGINMVWNSLLVEQRPAPLRPSDELEVVPGAVEGRQAQGEPVEGAHDR